MSKAKKIKEALIIIIRLLGKCKIQETLDKKEFKQLNEDYNKLNKIVKEIK